VSAATRRELLNQRLCAQHPHIVHLREAFLTPGHLGIAMEYATSGDLLDYVEAHMAHVSSPACGF
jgi:serine/threonine protein kinase